MKRFFYALAIGLFIMGVAVTVPQLTGQGNILIGLSLELGLTFLGIMFLIGFVGGWYHFGKLQEKREEEERRQAEQDRNNELMRQYLERKLQEENEAKR